MFLHHSLQTARREEQLLLPLLLPHVHPVHLIILHVAQRLFVQTAGKSDLLLKSHLKDRLPHCYLQMIRSNWSVLTVPISFSCLTNDVSFCTYL